MLRAPSWNFPGKGTVALFFYHPQTEPETRPVEDHFLLRWIWGVPRGRLQGSKLANKLCLDVKVIINALHFFTCIIVFCVCIIRNINVYM